jgi:hypothetical protein
MNSITTALYLTIVCLTLIFCLIWLIGSYSTLLYSLLLYLFCTSMLVNILFEEQAPAYLLVLAKIFFDPEMEAICSSETSVASQQTTRRHIPEDDTLHNHCCGNLKSYNILFVCNCPCTYVSSFRFHLPDCAHCIISSCCSRVNTCK